MSDTTVIVTDEKVTIGRGRNRFTATLVKVGDETFAQGRSGKFYSACGDCDGGWSGSKAHYAGIMEGVCFRCGGRGFYRQYESADKIIALAKRRVTDRARRDRKAAEKEAVAAAAAATWRAEHPAEAAAADEVMADAPKGYDDYEGHDAWIEKWSDFVTSLANQQQFRPLSEKQTAAFLPAYEEAKAARAEAEEVASKQRYLDAAEGAKVTVTGTVAVAMNIDSTSYTGFPETKRLVIVEADGDDAGVTLKMFGTAKALWESERGQRVEVTGTVKEFTEYQGVPQTVLIRPKIKVTQEVTA